MASSFRIPGQRLERTGEALDKQVCVHFSGPLPPKTCLYKFLHRYGHGVGDSNQSRSTLLKIGGCTTMLEDERTEQMPND